MKKTYEQGFQDALRAAVEVVQRQPNYPDTNVDMRQEWVRTQIVEKLAALSKARIEAPPCATCGGSGVFLARGDEPCPDCAKKATP